MNFKSASDAAVADKLAELQTQRAEVDRTLTPEDAKETAEAFAVQTCAFFESQTPPESIVGGAVLTPEQRLQIALAYISRQSEFIEYLVSKATAAGIVGELDRAGKAKKLATLDAEIEKVRSESNARRIATAKAEAATRAEEEIAALEQELARTA